MSKNKVYEMSLNIKLSLIDFKLEVFGLINCYKILLKCLILSGNYIIKVLLNCQLISIFS
jgi:hypothetical protein